MSSPTSTVLGIHRGAIDQSTVTTLPPQEVMQRVNSALNNMGVITMAESTYKISCVRPRKDGEPESTASPDSDSEDEENESTPTASTIPLPSVSPQAVDPMYGDLEPGDEVRFSVELTKLEGLTETYSLDIRRMKGNLRSYKFVYDTLREKVDLQTT